MRRDYAKVLPDEAMQDDCRQLVRLAVREDLERSVDWTTVSIVPAERRGSCAVVPRETGICAGLVTVPWIIDEMEADLTAEIIGQDGTKMTAGESILNLTGNARDLLTCERLILNVLSKLCGIATLTRRYVDRLEGCSARLYDTRKTTPGWRRLEKYAVGCGGGHNHRTGLFDGFLIKDNHLALASNTPGESLSTREAVETARRWAGGRADMTGAPEIVEIEVDSMDQFANVLPAGPDIVLLDNFTLEQLTAAVRLRNAEAPDVELEASGGVTIETLREIALTGVDRISSGALTHQAVWLDLGLDWRSENAT